MGSGMPAIEGWTLAALGVGSVFFAGGWSAVLGVGVHRDNVAMIAAGAVGLGYCAALFLGSAFLCCVTREPFYQFMRLIRESWRIRVLVAATMFLYCSGLVVMIVLGACLDGLSAGQRAGLIAAGATALAHEVVPTMLLSVVLACYCCIATTSQV